jgi:hypothetical protein
MDTPGEDAIQRSDHGATDGWLDRAEARQPFGMLVKPAHVAIAQGLTRKTHQGTERKGVSQAVVDGLREAKIAYMRDVGHTSAIIAKSLRERVLGCRSLEEAAALVAAFEPVARIAKPVFGLGAEGVTQAGDGLMDEPEVIDLDDLEAAVVVDAD